MVRPGEGDFFVLKEKIRWILLDSWLLHFQGNDLDEMISEVLTNQGEDELPEESREMYIYDTIDSYVFSTYTPLLASQGKEWLAYILGTDHPLFEKIQMVFGLNDLVPDPDNTWYREDATSNETMMLLYSSHINGETG